jgi:hypothetical protein
MKQFWNLYQKIKKIPRIAYIETLKTDFDRLIYNCGGILGLWFGLSPINAADLIKHWLQILRNIIIRIAHYLLAILKELIICIIAIILTFKVLILKFVTFPIT